MTDQETAKYGEKPADYSGIDDFDPERHIICLANIPEFPGCDYPVLCRMCGVTRRLDEVYSGTENDNWYHVHRLSGVPV